MTTPVRRRLSDHITEALTAMATRITAKHPDRANDLVDWMQTAHTRLTYRAAADKTRNGRIDTRSMFIEVLVDFGPNVPMLPLCKVRVRDLVDANGQPIDGQATARELLWQLGVNIPDDPSELTADE
jgi:hypothetical protein